MKNLGGKWTGMIAAFAATFGTAGAVQAQGVQVNTLVNDGLFNPRGITVGSDGALYIAEAGIGGSGPSIIGANNENYSYGTTGSVYRFQGNAGARVLTGLPSLADQGGATPRANAVGLHDVTFKGGTLYGVLGWVGDPALRSTFNNGPTNLGNDFGWLVQLTTDNSNNFTKVADISAFEGTDNPDAPELNSNPYSLAPTTTGFVVVDAGGNDLLNVNATNDVSLITKFDPQPTPGGGPPPFYQTVPTAVAVAPNGTYYVSELTGFPFPVGGADIYAVRNGTVTEIPNVDLTTVIDLVYGPDGYLYTLELTSNGLAGGDPGPGILRKINPVSGDSRILLDNGLFFPGGMAFGNDGLLYVTNFGVTPGGGQLLQISGVTAPEPATLALLVFGGGLLALRRRQVIGQGTRKDA